MSDYSVSTEYPTVHRTSDPLLIRIEKLVLQVENTVYNAVIKFGVKFCGFYVYQNSTGYPVYMYKDDELTSAWARIDNNTQSPALTSKQVEEQLTEKAKIWIDNLERSIAEHRSDNEVKKAIDRLCWQLHYDITESDTDFVERFPDFAEVAIDTPDYTIRRIVSDGADAVSDAVSGGATTIVGNASSGSGLYGVESKINALTTNLTGDNGAIKRYIGDNLYSANTDTNISARLNKIATNLRADGDDPDTREFTISRALRDRADTNYSVSGATYEQTQLEQQHFTEISVNQLGAFGTGDSGEQGHRTLYATLGGYTDSTKNSLSDAIGFTGDTSDQSTISGRIVKIDANVGHDVVGQNPATGLYVKTNAISDLIGVPLDENEQEPASGGDTLFEAVYRHPGFLHYDRNGYGVNFPTSNSSVMSHLLSGNQSSVKSVVGNIDTKVDTIIGQVYDANDSRTLRFFVTDMHNAMHGNGSLNGYAVPGSNSFYVRTSD